MAKPSWLAGPPPLDVPLPAAVLRVAGAEPLSPVWLNQRGGLTCEAGVGARRRYVKWAPAGSGLDLAQEAARMRWAAPYAAVPRVVAEGHDEEGSWLVTAALPGTTAVAEIWKRQPLIAVTAVGRGLRALHDALPVEKCPFSWSAEDRLADVRRRVTADQVNPRLWHPEHRRLSMEDVLSLLADPPPVDRLVVCHGDACSPNTLIDGDSRCSGHVDLGSLGLADRWADLAIATWSATWNFGPGWEGALLAAYGVSPDEQRTRYYRLLWDLGP